jgi:hypothetical protein
MEIQMAEQPSFEIALVGHRETRAVTPRKDESGRIVELVPGKCQAFLTFSINGRDPFEVEVPHDQYVQNVLPELG